MSSETGLSYPMTMISEVWRVPRSTIYAARDRARRTMPPEPRKRGPKTAMSDEDLVVEIREVLRTSEFLGEGHRKVRARLRSKGIRVGKNRVLRLIRENSLLVEASRRALRIGEAAADSGFEKRLEVIRRGVYPRRFMLPERPVEPVSFPLSVAAWDTVVAMLREYLLTHHCEGLRSRLRHPFRENFGNWVGEKLLALGPENRTLFPPFRERIHDAHALDAGDALG